MHACFRGTIPNVRDAVRECFRVSVQCQHLRARRDSVLFFRQPSRPSGMPLWRARPACGATATVRHARTLPTQVQVDMTTASTKDAWPNPPWAGMICCCNWADDLAMICAPPVCTSSTDVLRWAAWGVLEVLRQPRLGTRAIAPALTSPQLWTPRAFWI